MLENIKNMKVKIAQNSHSKYTDVKSYKGMTNPL